MSRELWTTVERYLAEIVAPADAALDAALDESARAGMPAIAVAPNEGKLLFVLARLVRANRILEIGTLGGYSAIWMARALPAGGRLITLEADAKHAEVARANLDRAGLAAVVDVRVGLALDTLRKLAHQTVIPFDLVFIDADKKNNPEYFEWALRLTRPGAVIVIDNVIRDGAVIDASSTDPNIQGIRRLNELLRLEKRVTATTLQTVGSKGYDGFTLALVTGDE